MFDIQRNEIPCVYFKKFSIKAFMKHCIKTNKMTLGGLWNESSSTLHSIMASWQPEKKNNNKISLAYYSNSKRE